jgi:hypothetical protein
VTGLQCGRRVGRSSGSLYARGVQRDAKRVTSRTSLGGGRVGGGGARHPASDRRGATAVRSGGSLSPSHLAGRLGGMTVRTSLLAAAAFLSARFCLSVLPDFLLLDWRGDLSATAGSSGSRGGAPRSVPRLPASAEPALTGPQLTVLGPLAMRNGSSSGGPLDVYLGFGGPGVRRRLLS